jgi:hypothetical protein
MLQTPFEGAPLSAQVGSDIRCNMLAVSMVSCSLLFRVSPQACGDLFGQFRNFVFPLMSNLAITDKCIRAAC